MKQKVDLAIVFGFATIALFFTSQILILNELDYKTSLSFEDEDVIITITGDNAFLSARYGLKNYGKSESYIVSLPFASRPWDINLTFDGLPLDYSWTTMSISPEPETFDTIIFRVELEPDQKGDVLVSYKRNYELVVEEDSSSIVFRYIVGSTKSWGEPLIFAHFEFWLQGNESDTLLESRDYTNWMPTETFLFFEYLL